MDRGFDWDPNKAEQNQLKHDITFSQATEVFSDPKAFTEQDTRFNYGETRRKIVGATSDAVIVAVIFTERHGLIRLISARRANRSERGTYDSRPGS